MSRQTQENQELEMVSGKWLIVVAAVVALS